MNKSMEMDAAEEASLWPPKAELLMPKFAPLAVAERLRAAHWHATRRPNHYTMIG